TTCFFTISLITLIRFVSQQANSPRGNQEIIKMDNIIILCHIAEFQTQGRRFRKDKTWVAEGEAGRFVRPAGLEPVLHTDGGNKIVVLDTAEVLASVDSVVTVVINVCTVFLFMKISRPGACYCRG
ncbi:hypothetical protein, partial [Candidatus Symbiopectobacterium sp. NZEC135]|uniref:hypothetical protein n=1 Tax=Candidatus Symbiopectobacterium sp. NZEC135 TaxID=2820471 RepID=UPI002227306B